MSATSYDAVIVGGGPGGASAAIRLATLGRRVLLLERETFPRYQIGESLIPYTYKLLARLGVLDKVRRAGFVPKPGFHFVSPNGNLASPIYFNDFIQDPEFGCWEVERARFDAILLDHAREVGVEVREQATATDLIREGERVVGVRFRASPDGPLEEARATWVVDASGRGTFLAGHFGTKKRDPVLDQLAVWRYLRGAYRQPGRDEGNILIALLAPRGWCWWIPLSDDVVSVGVVSSRSWLSQTGSTLQAIFEENLRKNALLARWSEKGEWISDFKTAADYSYTTTAPSGPGWVMLGDAGTFVDPVFSSGMFLSMASGLMAADSMDDALERGDLASHTFDDYDVYVARASITFRMFVDAFYDERFSTRQLVKDHPEWLEDWGRVLQGDVFEENRPFIRFLNDYRARLAERDDTTPSILVPPGWDFGVDRRELRLPPPIDLSARRARAAGQIISRPSGARAAPDRRAPRSS
jgi:flavin-dependent dehydrogenase